ncbi:phosphatase PAP2 family protein [Sphingomonas sp. KR3-1]|uniref:acid phosphatase n=1 Tax=Sphingomonas sp. KR3-1 TaxID=3156611 RepID=UPI0032B5EEA7
MRTPLAPALAGALLLLTSGAASQDAAPATAKPLPQGYLARSDYPDSLALLPPPPEAGSPAFARDEAVSAAMTRPPGSPRWTQAARDADLDFAHLAQTFACAAGFAPDPTATPVLFKLLGKSAVDIGLSTYKAKTHYQRTRPFMAHGNATCFPKDEAALRSDGSYPSGHSAIGWGWALIFTEIAPHHADAILARGRDFGESRLVCNAHWESDVEAGRVVAAAAVARLHADPGFRADLLKAKAEALRAPLPAEAACATEAAGLRG